MKNHVALTAEQVESPVPQPLFEHTTRRAPHMERFVCIEAIPTKEWPDTHRVYLQIRNQRFTVTPFDCETLAEAEWIRDMLCIALANLVNEVSGDLLRACEDCMENRGDWAAVMGDAIRKARGEQ